MTWRPLRPLYLNSQQVGSNDDPRDHETPHARLDLDSLDASVCDRPFELGRRRASEGDDVRRGIAALWR